MWRGVAEKKKKKHIKGEPNSPPSEQANPKGIHDVRKNFGAMQVLDYQIEDQNFKRPVEHTDLKEIGDKHEPDNCVEFYHIAAVLATLFI